MRLLRLRISNYRGVATAEVVFGSSGITLVTGPNEVGKTSLGEAIGILFEYPDSSKHRSVEAIRPTHQDQGPEIELQAEAGPYAFTYFKRFYKRPETTLVITRPAAESRTGREAHDRAEAILRETIDTDLWKALNVQQGDAIQQPELTKQTSLSAALDAAAGGRPSGPGEENLFERARGEFGRYFTERGAERKDLQEARKLQEDTQAEVADIEGRLRALERDIDRAAALQRETAQLQKQEEDLIAAVDGYTTTLGEIDTLENAVSAARLKLESARKSEQAAIRDAKVRQELIDAVTGAASDLTGLQESSATALDALNSAEEELTEAQRLFGEVDSERKAGEAHAALRRGDFDYYNNKLHLEQLEERKGRIDEARKSAAEAKELLTANTMDSDALEAIEEAERELLVARAQLETGAPGVLLRGRAECRLQIDDDDVVLGKDEVRTLSVADGVRMSIPDALDIEITAGSSTEDLTRKVVESERSLDALCTAAGITDADDARRAFESRNDALQRVEAKGQVEIDNLRDLTYEELDQKLVGLRRSVSDYLTKRVTEPSIPPDLDSAKRECAMAETEKDRVNRTWEESRESLDGARCVRDGLREQHQEARIRLDVGEKELGRKREALERARTTASDEDLDVAGEEATAAVSDEESQVRAAEESLLAKNPERTRALAETARGSLQTTQNRRNAAQTEQTEVQTRLKIHGEEGLHGSLHEAKTRFERVEVDNQALFRRAGAAKLLLETMREERDKARRAYVAPLKEKIEYLGRLVFDESFQVEIDDDLLITSRTADGVTVPFDSLSGGTREQLSLVFRLACSMIVAEDGGAPVVLDDALGYTDPERLRLMGAVLAQAAKECQIIIFTCVPDRYANIGAATVVPLA